MDPKMNPKTDPKNTPKTCFAGTPCQAPSREAPGSPNRFKTNEKHPQKKSTSKDGKRLISDLVRDTQCQKIVYWMPCRGTAIFLACLSP